jgi:hypothetical protein
VPFCGAANKNQLLLFGEMGAAWAEQTAQVCLNGLE